MYVPQVAKGVWIWLSVKIIKHNVNIADTSHGDLMYVCVLGLLFDNAAAFKIITTNYKIYNILCLNKLIYTFLK